MSLVGIIANPSAGRDIRRLTAHGRVVTTLEKVNVLRRVLLALDAVGVERVLMMPDRSMLSRLATEDISLTLRVEVLDMAVHGAEDDSARAAALMAERGAGCIVTLGGDGTNRAVALGCGTVPLVPISTGTNNVFPAMVEGTTAGLAAGIVARGLVEPADAVATQKRLEVYVDGVLREIALIDVAVSRQQFVAARAIWDVADLTQLLLTRAEPTAIGLSSIGAALRPLFGDEPGGLHVRLGPGGCSVLAAVAPGMVQTVPVAGWAMLQTGDRVALTERSGTIAVDGERQLELLPGHHVEIGVSADGPRVVDIAATLRLAAERGLFIDFPGSG